MLKISRDLFSRSLLVRLFAFIYPAAVAAAATTAGYWLLNAVLFWLSSLTPLRCLFCYCAVFLFLSSSSLLFFKWHVIKYYHFSASFLFYFNLKMKKKWMKYNSEWKVWWYTNNNNNNDVNISIHFMLIWFAAYFLHLISRLPRSQVQSELTELA